MGKNSMTLNMKGFDDMLERIKKANGSIESAAEKALVEGVKPFQQDLQVGIKKHYRTGLTESTLKEPNVRWNGNVASISAGFDINKGGLPAIFLEYGTPKQRPRPFIRPAIERNKSKARNIQKRELTKILKELEK